MEWQDELRQIVERETAIPTFEEWMETTGRYEITGNASSPHYRRTFGIK